MQTTVTGPATTSPLPTPLLTAGVAADGPQPAATSQYVPLPDATQREKFIADQLRSALGALSPFHVTLPSGRPLMLTSGEQKRLLQKASLHTKQALFQLTEGMDQFDLSHECLSTVSPTANVGSLTRLAASALTLWDHTPATFQFRSCSQLEKAQLAERALGYIVQALQLL